MPFTVRIANQNKSFIVHDNESILDAALRQNFDIPHSCCEGICGSCEAQVIDGKIDYENADQLSLDEADRNEGRALLCCAKAHSDLLIHSPECASPSRQTLPEFEYQLIEMHALTDDIHQCFFKPLSQPIHYLAGQYVLIECVPHEAPKPFSIANAPNAEHLLELHIRCQSDNMPTQQLIKNIRQHGKLKFQGPVGNCYYHARPAMPAVLLAVGTGFAPIKAILEATFKNALTHEVRLFWAGKSPSDLYQLALVEEWAKTIPRFSVTPILAQASQNLEWPYEYGNIIHAVCDSYPTLANHHIYFGGPMQLTIDGIEQFVACGAETCYMYSDVFDML